MKNLVRLFLDLGRGSQELGTLAALEYNAVEQTNETLLNRLEWRWSFRPAPCNICSASHFAFGHSAILRRLLTPFLPYFVNIRCTDLLATVNPGLAGVTQAE